MIRNFLYNFLKSLYTYFSHYKRIFLIFKGFNTLSYSVDKGKIKTKTSQFLDYLYLFFVLRILPSNYHLFCFDTKKRKEFKKYVGSMSSDPYTANKFSILWGRNGILLDDKYIFKVICIYHDLPVPAHYGIYNDGLQNSQKTDLQHLMLTNNLDKIILKPRLGAYGAGIRFVLRDELNNSDALAWLPKGECIIEEKIRQHPELDRINPNSVNSIRIITFLCTDGSVEFLGAMLRTSSSNFPVDNFTMGGVAIGIDMSTGRLKKEGFLRFFHSHEPIELKMPLNLDSIKKTFATMNKKKLLRPGEILIRHPLTQTQFFNFQIPYWNELKEISIKVQKIFYHIQSIGLDIAITSEGPVIIEGNQHWGTIGFQATNGGLLTNKNKRLFSQYGISFYE